MDTNGLPHTIFVTTANITDRNGALEMFRLHHENLSKVAKILADGGYSGNNFAKSASKILGSKVEIAKRNELHKFVVIPKRGVVERSFDLFFATISNT